MSTEESLNEEIKKSKYFSNRGVVEDIYSGYKLPKFLLPFFPEKDKQLNILDIGCGFGQLLNALKSKGFENIYGIDINDESIQSCTKRGIDAEKITDIREYAKKSNKKFDLIVMSHVLEHINKELIIDTLSHIKKYLLKDGGKFLLMVPNAQSSTGTYWRYEDFTHTILFTAGSCLYVLKSAGFTNIEFIDPNGTRYMNPIKRMLISPFIFYYKLKEKFWHKILQTSYHKPSPAIYTFDLRVAAS